MTVIAEQEEKMIIIDPSITLTPCAQQKTQTKYRMKQANYNLGVSTRRLQLQIAVAVEFSEAKVPVTMLNPFILCLHHT